MCGLLSALHKFKSRFTSQSFQAKTVSQNPRKMESCDGAAARQIVGAEFTDEVPSLRDGPSVAVPPRAQRESDKLFPPPSCLEPGDGSVPMQFSSKNGIRTRVVRQQDDVTLPATLSPALRPSPQPCGGYEVKAKEGEPREGLTCVHCKLILRDAMQTEDGLRVCRSCLQEVKYVLTQLATSLFMC